MAHPNRHRRDRAAEYRRFVLQKQLVERHFPVFTCELRNNVLQCVGSIVPSEHCGSYRIGIRYKKGGIPEVRVRDPIIPREHYSRAHIYREGSLCLFDHRDRPWSAMDDLHATIIPWTAEWLVLYELFLVCGKWLGPETAHGTSPKEPQEPEK